MSKKFYIIIFLIILGFGYYSRYISTRGLIVKEYAYSNKKLPTEFIGKKIIHFSDLHFSKSVNEKELILLVKTINEIKPDICVFTGDLIDKYYKISAAEKELLIKHLGNIKAELGKYAVKGNHDYENSFFEEIMNKSNFKLLKNSNDLIYYKGNEPIFIAGTPSMLKDKVKIESTFKDQKEYFTIYLAHEPDVLKKVRGEEIDLMLSGHSHGGQVRFPFIGALYSPVGSKLYYEEHYKKDETDLYISSGIGTSSIRIRFLNKPSINLYRLDNK